VIEVPAAARGQAGAFTADQALAQGWTGRQLRRRLASGTWIRLPGKSLAAADCPRSAWRDAWGVWLAWPDAVAAFRTAAELYGLPLEADGGPHVWVPTWRKTPRVAVHTGPLRTDELQFLDEGLGVTSWLRTVTDCLALSDLDEALDLYAWLTTRERLTRGTFMGQVRARFGRPGSGQLQRLARITRTGGVSAGEYRLHTLLQAAGITGWSANAQVYDAAGLIGRVDLLFPSERLVIEVDGERAHTGRRTFVRDRQRQNRLMLAGCTVLRYTWWDIVDRPADVVAQIRRALTTGAR